MCRALGLYLPLFSNISTLTTYRPISMRSKVPMTRAIRTLFIRDKRIARRRARSKKTLTVTRPERPCLTPHSATAHLRVEVIYGTTKIALRASTRFAITRSRVTGRDQGCGHSTISRAVANAGAGKELSAKDEERTVRLQDKDKMHSRTRMNIVEAIGLPGQTQCLEAAYSFDSVL